MSLGRSFIMLSYEQLIATYPKELGRPDAILLLYSGLANARIQRRTAAMEVQHLLDDCRCSSAGTFFFHDESRKLLVQRAQKYLQILQGQMCEDFDEEDVDFLLSSAGQPLHDLIAKHGLIILAADKSVSYTQAWR